MYDTSRKRVLLFGGELAASSSAFNDTWEWDGEYWTQLADIGPSPRSSMAMAYDSGRNRIVLFGGSAGSAAGDTWELPTT